MTEVAIKEHTRRGKDGKTVHVRGYTRRVGRKGIHSPKRKRKKNEGKEFEEKVNEKKKEQESQMSPEELEKRLRERREWEESARRAEEERKSLGMSKEQYSSYKIKQLKKKQEAQKSSHTKKVHKPLSPKGSQTILDRIEDKIAEFVNKYSKKKYKKYL